MKIAYLSTFYPYRGGIAAFNASLYSELEKLNDIIPYTFKLQYPPFLFPGKTQMVESGDNATIVNSRRVLNSINPLSYIRTASIINKQKPEVLLTKFWIPYFAPSLGYIAGRVRATTSTISILDNIIPHELRYGDMSLIKYFLSKNDGFVVMSENVKNDLLSLKPDAKYIFHQHPLYNHFGNKLMKRESRAILGLPTDKKILLCFGFIRDYKGLDLAISTIKKLDKSYHLVIAGEVYGSFDKYQDQINNLGVKDRITLHTRYISDDETPIFFSAADACLLPYKSATQSGIVAIAYHFDLPVIATRVGGLADMIEPFGAGVVADKASVDSLIQAISIFSSNNPKDFVTNIDKYKSLASWSSLANSITDFAKELKSL